MEQNNSFDAKYHEFTGKSMAFLDALNMGTRTGNMKLTKSLATKFTISESLTEKIAFLVSADLLSVSEAETLADSLGKFDTEQLKTGIPVHRDYLIEEANEAERLYYMLSALTEV